MMPARSAFSRHPSLPRRPGWEHPLSQGTNTASGLARPARSSTSATRVPSGASAATGPAAPAPFRLAPCDRDRASASVSGRTGKAAAAAYASGMTWNCPASSASRRAASSR